MRSPCYCEDCSPVNCLICDAERMRRKKEAVLIKFDKKHLPISKKILFQFDKTKKLEFS